MATPAEEAVFKAKAIAARLSGSSSPSEITTVGHTVANAPTQQTAGLSGRFVSGKRKRWGAVPIHGAKVHIEMLPGLADAAKRFKQTADPVTKRIWVSTSPQRPEGHYLAYLQPKLESLLVEFDDQTSRGGRPSHEISIELKGRGSSRDPPLPGMPEEPMHILISGTAELVDKVERRLDVILADADKAPIEDLGKNLSHQGNRSDSAERDDSMALAALPLQKSAAASYRPATVAQLIANVPSGLSALGDTVEEKIGVPNGVVGYLIGRGGETISSMQSRSGCKIQIQKEHELQPGQSQRVITLSAQTKDSIDQCRGMIESMVQDRIRATGGGSGGSSTGNCVTLVGSPSKEIKVNDAIAAGHALLQVRVPDADVGLIIGKSGATIKNIQETTGASIQIPPSGNADDPTVRTVSITHPTNEGAQWAKGQIEDLLKSKPSYAASQGIQVTVQVLVGSSLHFQIIFPLANLHVNYSQPALFPTDPRQRCGPVHWEAGMRDS